MDFHVCHFQFSENFRAQIATTMHLRASPLLDYQFRLAGIHTLALCAVLGFVLYRLRFL